MSWVTIVLSAAAAIALTLGGIHLLVWLQNRKALANLVFSLATLVVPGFAVCELLLMHTGSPAEYGLIIRWAHLPLFLLVLSIVGFVSLYFGTGRAWLAWAAVGTPLLSLIVNFFSFPNLTYREITSLVQVNFLGEKVWVVGQATLSPMASLVELSSALLLVFVVDASLRLWSTGGREGRRRALVVGGGISVFILVAGSIAWLISHDVLDIPYLLSLPFLAIVLAMGYELSRDVVHATRLAEELHDNAESAEIAASAAHVAHWRWEVQHDSIWLIRNGRRLFGLPEETTLDLSRFLQVVHPDDREPLRQAVQRAIGGEGLYATEYRIVYPGGDVRWFAGRGKVEYDADHQPLRMRGVSIEITERKRAEAVLFKLAERYQTITTTTPDGVWEVDTDGKIVDANNECCRLYGYSRDELLTRSIKDLEATRNPEETRLHIQSIMAKGHARFETRHRRKDGRILDIEVSTTYLRSSSTFLAFLHDITAQKAAEIEAAKHRAELAHLTRVTTLSELSGSLAHELNQPLGIILSNAQAAQELLVQDPPDVDEVKDILSDIVAADRRAGEIIQRLRALLKRGETTLLPLPLNDLIDEVLRLTHADLIGRGVTVIQDFAPDLPLIIGDRIQIQQLVLNLFINAADAMATNAPGNRKLHIKTARYEKFALGSVRDEGIGLPQNTERLFEPFYTTKSHGLGMGLAICRSIVDAHRGRIWGESHPERGAVFYFELPFAASPTRSSAQPP